MIFLKIAVLFGSSSNEHEVSVVSAASIIKNLNKEKYQITPIYMDKTNKFYEWKADINNIKPLKIGILPKELEAIDNIFAYLKKFNLVFIMIHGKNGEDGILSAILDFLGVKYVANKMNASIVSMDKILTKDILEANNIKTAKYLYFNKYNAKYLWKDQELDFEELLSKIECYFAYPVFVKPSNSGSSIGVSKASNHQELEEAIIKALKIDSRILVEEAIIGREVECGILEKNKELLASVVGEVLSAEEFYSFDAKYKIAESKTVIPANISEEIANTVRALAIKVFRILNCHGYSRVDFFIKDNQEIILNEINTIPGFTEISMYPKLFEASGIKYEELLDIIIDEALNK